jgi:hypothetical protein
MKRLFLLVLILGLIAPGFAQVSPVKASSLKLDTNGDGTFSTFQETDIDQRINVNYDDAVTSEMLVYTGTGVSWVCRGLADLGIAPPGNTIIVAKSGGNYNTIAEGVAAAVSGDVVLIYPGTYTVTNLNINKAIALVGIDRDNCIIQQDNVVTGTVTYTSGVVNCTVSGITLENLTIQNIGSDDGTYATPAVITSSGICWIRNCRIRGNGGRDIFDILGTSTTYCYGVEVEQYALGSAASHAIWVDNSANLYFEHSKTIVSGSGSGAQVNTTGDCYFRFSRLSGASYALDITNCDILELRHCTTNATSFLSTENYNSLDDGFSDFLDISVDDILGNYITCTGSAIFGGEADSATMEWDVATNKMILTASGYDPVNLYSTEEETPKLKTDNIFSANSFLTGSTERISAAGVGTLTQANVDNVQVDGNTISATNSGGDITLTPNGTGDVKASAGDVQITTDAGQVVIGASDTVNLYRSAANTLKTDDAFIGGSTGTFASYLTVQSGSGIFLSNTAAKLQWYSGASYDVELSRSAADTLYTPDTFSAGAGLNCNATIWRNFAAAVDAAGNVAGYGVANELGNPYSTTGWMENAINAPTFITTSEDGACVYFPVPYLAGSVITQIRVRWQAIGNADGVLLRLVKRVESGTDTAWTLVGAQQTYTDLGTPYPVTLSTYDIADTTLDADTFYAIEIKSQMMATGVNLYSVGIETSKRVY